MLSRSVSLATVAYSPDSSIRFQRSRTLGTVSENSPASTGYVAQLCRIGEALNSLVLLFRHRLKSSNSAKLRGHSSRKAAADAVFLVEGDAGKRRVIRQKMKDAEVAALVGLCASLNRDGQPAAGASTVAHACLAVREGTRLREARAVRQEASTWGA